MSRADPPEQPLSAASAGGATAAAQAIAAGEPGVGRSLRFHRPRGPLCGRGHCFQCEIAGPDGRVLACQAPATGAHRRRLDLLRPLGAVAERFPPWFYERRFLRPAALRGPALTLLRRLSAAGTLGHAVAPPPARVYEELEHPLVVVGAGAGIEDAYVVDAAGGALAVGVYPDRRLGVLRDDRLTLVHFERLVLATGSYERLPTISGNDLPGVVGLRAAEQYAAAGALAPGLRLAVWAPADGLARARELADDHGLAVVWASRTAPARIAGRRRVSAVETPGRTPCDLFVCGVEQPAIELALQAGATGRLTTDGLPIVVADDLPAWLELRGAAARRSAGVPTAPAADDAFACLCEDVRVGDLKACVAQGFAHPELVKRRTGAMTGPCQGKLCQAAVLDVLRREGVDLGATRARPLARPVTLRELAADA